MKQSLDAIYENGVLRPLRSLSVTEGQKVRLTIEAETSGGSDDLLGLAGEVYQGLTEGEINDVERIALKRDAFFAMGNQAPGARHE